MTSSPQKILERAAFVHAVGRPLRPDDIDASESVIVNKLCSEGYLINKNGNFYVERFGGEFVENNCSEQLMAKVKRYKFVLSLCPFVKEIAVCNTVSFGTADDESDIDFFIILDSERFYFGRLMTTLVVHLFGLRRHRQKIASRFCLSFFVSEKSLDLSELLIEDDVYFYYWFYYLNFLKGNYELQLQLLDSNSWFDSNEFSFSNEFKINTFVMTRLFETIVGFKVFNWIERFLKNWQLKRANLKKKELGNPKGVVIKDGILKFHVVDIREEFRDKFYRSFAR